MLKVLMLGWECYPYIRGGLGTHCYELLNELRKKNIKTYFMTPHPIHKKIGNVEIIGLDITQKYKEKGKIINYGKYLKQKEKEYASKAPKAALKLDFDLIHSQDRMPIDAAIKIKKLSKKPLLVTIHSTEFDKSKKIGKQRYKKENRGMKAANKIIAISDYTKNIIVSKYSINPKKIFVIGNGIKKREIPKKKFGKTKYILSLGRIVYQKGLPHLIDAAKKVVEKDKNVKFLIVGSGMKKYVNKLKKKVKKLGLEKHVSFLGFVPNTAIYYKKAYLFVMPSVSEPFGITPLEALSYGNPSIISKQSGIAKYYKNCLKVDYWDSEALAKKILFLLSNRSSYNKLRKAAIKELKDFSWEDVAEKTLRLYYKIV